MGSVFSENIFEAVIETVDLKKGECSIRPLNVKSSSPIPAILPYIAGIDNAGFFINIKPGSRVVAAFTSGRSPNVTVILAFLPSKNLFPDFFDPFNRPKDLRRGLGPYPRIKDGELILKGDAGSKLGLINNGDIVITGINGAGLSLYKNVDKMAGLFAIQDLNQFTNAGRVISGVIRRVTGTQRGLYPISDLSASPLFTDTNYYKVAKPIGLFPRSIPSRRTFNGEKQKRNPELSEFRVVINEFATDSMFTGFDDEFLRSSGKMSMYDNMETFARNREPSNLLHLAEHELIEFVGGNLVDINGLILDINHEKLFYGDSNSVPQAITKEAYEEARKISRRGIGCHFQLTTNAKTDDKSISTKNLLLDVDKQGFVKFNIPASTYYGNIPYSSSTNYTAGKGDGVVVSRLNPSIKERVPVTLRDEDGNIVKPSGTVPYRMTGVKVVGQNGALSSKSSEVKEDRINSTKYHNMYAAAERLIANKIRNIYIPPIFTGPDGVLEGTSNFKPFEIVKKDKELYPTYMSTVEIIPDKPAIYHGGGGLSGQQGMAIAGEFYVDSDQNPSYSNTTNQEDIENDKFRSYGGKSLNGNIEGAVELSIGRDDWDQKSIVLDTYGSIISWLGNDKNGRSMVLQTDGDVLINIGGSYPKQGNSSVIPAMNVGRLDLRVNVVDKGFMPDQGAENRSPRDGGNSGADSDYIISISEQGLVIAGMKKEAPMVIRNDGPILMESSSASVTLKGTQVVVVDQKGVSKILTPGKSR